MRPDIHITSTPICRRSTHRVSRSTPRGRRSTQRGKMNRELEWDGGERNISRNGSDTFLKLAIVFSLGGRVVNNM